MFFSESSLYKLIYSKLIVFVKYFKDTPQYNMMSCRLIYELYSGRYIILCECPVTIFYIPRRTCS